MTPPRNPTLQTVADAAGVSRSTVSLALRNHPALPPTTRERIQKIAEQIGYRPNPMISTLMAHLKTSSPLPERGTIAFLTSHPTRRGWAQIPLFQEYYDGAAAQAAALGYRVEEFWLREPQMTSVRMTSILENRGVAGIIVAPMPTGNGHVSLNVSHFAMVAIGYSMTRPKLHRVANHQIESIYIALRELRRRRHARIALVLDQNIEQRSNRNYSAGYLSFQQSLPLEARLPICMTDGMDAKEFGQWLRVHRPSALVAGTPEMLAWMAEVEIRVPEEIAVALLVVSGPLKRRGAGIDQQGKLTGAAAVETIVAQIHRNERGIPSHPKIMLTEGVWVNGDTVGPLAEESGTEGKAMPTGAERLSSASVRARIHSPYG